MKLKRRNFLQVIAGATAVTAIGSCANVVSEKVVSETNSNFKEITIGYWPNAAALPLFVALEKGFFKKVGLDAKTMKLGNPQQAVEAILADRIDATPTGLPAINLILGEVASPDLFKIIALNGSNSKHVLDQFIVAINSPVKKISELEGKKIAILPSVQFEVLGKAILKSNGIQDSQLVKLPLPQHIPAIQSAEVDAAFTIEPFPTVGKAKGITRTIETGVIAKYVLNDPNALWFGGAGTLSTRFIKSNPEAAKRYIEAFRLAIKSINDNPDEARQFIAKYVEIDENIAKLIPLPEYKLYESMSASDVEYFQKFVDLYSDNKVLTRRIDVTKLLLKQSDLG